MERIDSALWVTLLAAKQSPLWVPAAIAEVLSEAHGEGSVVDITPAGLHIDLSAERVVPLATAEGAEDNPETQIATCLAELLALSIDRPDVARHVFQQAALLWRAYRERQRIAQRSEFERTMVVQIVAALHSRHAEPWMQRLVRATDKRTIVTLHELIDALFETVRDMRRRN